jgi:hypothetical protein
MFSLNSIIIAPSFEALADPAHDHAHPQIFFFKPKLPYWMLHFVKGGVNFVIVPILKSVFIRKL